MAKSLDKILKNFHNIADDLEDLHESHQDEINEHNAIIEERVATVTSLRAEQHKAKQVHENLKALIGG